MDQTPASFDPTARDTALINWLIGEGTVGRPRRALIHGYCDRMVAHGVPMVRLHLAQTTLHPVYGSIGVDWFREAEGDQRHYPNTDRPPDDWLQSPFYHFLLNGFEDVHMRLDKGSDRDRFPVFAELRALGGTDYFATGIVLEDAPAGANFDPLNPPEGMLVSYVANAADGFSPADIASIRNTLPALALALKAEGNRQMAEDLLGVYLGADAGQRVLSGDLKRGSLDRIGAAICLFDLSGFTAATERLSGEDVIALLNAYFGEVTAVINEHGGQVLKFMGDGLLAVIDVGDDAADARAALAMASALDVRIAALNAARTVAGEEVMGYTLALHAGEVQYGNIGGEDRLDFTVIGAAVNQTARLSEMHRPLSQSIIISEAIRRAAGAERTDIVALGRYMLRGVPAPQELFTLLLPAGAR